MLCNAMLSCTYKGFSDAVGSLLSDPPNDEVCVGEGGNDSAIPRSTKFLPTIEDYTNLSESAL